MSIFRGLPTGAVKLEVECADRRVDSFVKEYAAATGRTLRPGQDFQVQPSAGGRKRGLEGRIYFNASAVEAAAIKAHWPSMAGPRSSGYLSSEYSYRIDRVALFWQLVNAGFRV